MKEQKKLEYGEDEWFARGQRGGPDTTKLADELPIIRQDSTVMLKYRIITKKAATMRRKLTIWEKTFKFVVHSLLV